MQRVRHATRPSLREVGHGTAESVVDGLVEQFQPALVQLRTERIAHVYRLVGAQRVAFVSRLAEELPRPEVDELRDVRAPVDMRRAKTGAEQIVHRDLTVEVADELHDPIVAVEIGQRHDDGANACSRCTTIGNNTLFSLWMWRCVSTSSSSRPSKHRRYETQPSAGAR